jgi:hypothetical protein
MGINMIINAFDFVFTPLPRNLNEEEVEKFHLRYYNSDIIQPVYEGTSNVWSAADTGKLPVYRLYNRGTNALLVLCYSWETDRWTEIELANIDNLYGLIWKIMVKFQSLQYKLPTNT